MTTTNDHQMIYGPEIVVDIGTELEPIPESSLGGYLAAVANHEAKALLISALTLGCRYDKGGLHGLFLAMQGSPPAYKGNAGNQFDYCQLSFEPIGAVAKASFGDSVSYELTEDGDIFGKALAGYFLQFSLDYPEVSLKELWGMTKTVSKTGDRPPVRRLWILEKLLDMGDTTIEDVAGSIDNVPNKVVTDQLKKLADAGIIGLESIGLRELELEYGLIDMDKAGDIASSSPALQHKVLGIITETIAQTGGTISLDEIEYRVRQDAHYSEQKRLRGNLTTVLNCLELQGAISRGKFNGRVLSRISINDGQRELIERVVGIVRGVQSQDAEFIEEGRRLGRQIVNDKDKVRLLINKAYAKSPEANQVPKEVRYAKVRNELARLGVATTTQIIELLAPQGIKKSSTVTTLSAMRRAGILESVLEDGENLWSISPDS